MAGQGAVHDVPGPQDVVGDRVRHVRFHERHVLVRRRVKDDVGLDVDEH